MQKSKSKRKKTPSTSRRKQPQNPKIIKHNLLNVYSSKPLVTKKQNLQRLKLQPQKQQKSKTSDYDFPQFAMYVRKETRKNKMEKSEVSKRSVNLDRSKIEEQFQKKKFVNGKVQKKNVEKDVNGKQESNQKQIAHPKKVDYQVQVQFIEALKKTFKMLDIFNRGKISQANINKWVPEALLYFLGKPLQKIRQERLTLTEKQFLNLCQAVLQDSSIEDIQEFITQATAYSCLKASVNMTQHHEQENMSPIKKRMIEQEIQRSSIQNSGILKKNKHLDNVIQMIKSREAQAGEKIRELKEKRRSITFKPLQEIKPNQCPRNGNQQRRQFESIGIQVSDFYHDKIKLCESIKQQSLKTSANIQKSIINQQSLNSKPLQIQRPYIANFTFQLPQVPPDHAPAPETHEYKHQKQPHYTVHKNRLRMLDQNILENSSFNRPLSARIENNKIGQHKIDEFNHTFRVVDSNEDMRIDRLRNKIDSYMRKNAEKIQKSRSFFLQMSPNHL